MANWGDGGLVFHALFCLWPPFSIVNVEILEIFFLIRLRLRPVDIRNRNQFSITFYSEILKQ